MAANNAQNSEAYNNMRAYLRGEPAPATNADTSEPPSAAYTNMRAYLNNSAPPPEGAIQRPQAPASLGETFGNALMQPSAAVGSAIARVGQAGASAIGARDTSDYLGELAKSTEDYWKPKNQVPDDISYAVFCL